MKRKILCVVLMMYLLVGTAVAAERKLYEIHLESNQYFLNRGGVAYVSDSIIEGSYRIEGRVLLQNINKKCIGYQEPTLYIYQNGKYVTEIRASAVTPKSTAPKGFTLLTYSGMDIPLSGLEDIKLSIISNVHVEEPKEVFLGTRTGDLELSSFSQSLWMSVDISDLKRGIYAVNLIAFDKNGQLAWAEDSTVNLKYDTIATWAIDNYEVILLEENGRSPAVVYGAVYRKQ